MRIMKLTLTIMLLLAISFAGSAYGQGRGNGNGGGIGNGGGNGGGPGEETTPNNLSVPAIFVGDALNLTFGVETVVYPESDIFDPLQEPFTGYSVPGNYYVQGIHLWQAESKYSELQPGQEQVYAKWGDNLIGDAKLKVGSPIRVEVGLYSLDPPVMTGWEVIKLEPEQLDRVSPYGTEVFADGSSDYATPYVPLENPVAGFLGIDSYPEVRVYDSAATWTIKDADGVDILPTSLASAEINSTGRIVYGYNLRVPNEGLYTIEFNAPRVDIMGTDPGATISEDGTTVTLTINVVPGGGKGGGRP